MYILHHNLHFKLLSSFYDWISRGWNSQCPAVQPTSHITTCCAAWKVDRWILQSENPIRPALCSAQSTAWGVSKFSVIFRRVKPFLPLGWKYQRIIPDIEIRAFLTANMCTSPIQVAPRLDMASQKKAAQAFHFRTPFDRKIQNYYFYYYCYCYYSARYGLDGPEIESRWGGEIFNTRPARPWGPPSPLPGLSRG